jgi:hypothetical protein
MFKAQYKSKSPFETWLSIGTYGSERMAVSAALKKKTAGAILVRVVDKQNRVIYSN